MTCDDLTDLKFELDSADAPRVGDTYYFFFGFSSFLCVDVAHVSSTTVTLNSRVQRQPIQATLRWFWSGYVQDCAVRLDHKIVFTTGTVAYPDDHLAKIQELSAELFSASCPF